MAQPEYQRFASKLIPSINPQTLLGVRLPRLRMLAKRIMRSGKWKDYLSSAVDDSFEEIMLQGMVIGQLEDLTEVFYWIKRFVPKINNWSVCDSFCSGLKIARIHQQEMWDFLQPFIHDKREYYLRFGIVMLLFYYVNDDYIDQVFTAVNQAKTDEYYSKMAAAWAVSVCYASYPQKTICYLIRSDLDDVVYHKALQKIGELKQVTLEEKQQLKKFKRKK